MTFAAEIAVRRWLKAKAVDEGSRVTLGLAHGTLRTPSARQP